MSDEVGKVSLGLELDTSDLGKQVDTAASSSGNRFAKTFKGAMGNLFKGFKGAAQPTDVTKAIKPSKAAPNVNTDAVKAQIDQLTQSLDLSNRKIEIQQQKLADLKSAQGGLTDTARQQMHALEQESASLEGQIRSLVQQIEALKSQQKGAISNFHADLISDDIKLLQADLTGLIAKADETGRKMAELDDKSGAGDFKLKDKITNAEAALLRLNQASDKTKSKIQQLNDSLSQAPVNSEPIAKLGTDLIKTNKPLRAVSGNLNRAAKAAANADKSFSGAGRGATRMGNSFTQAFSRILKQVFVFAVLYKAIRSFTDYMGGALKTNAQFAASLNAIQTNLRVAFQPIYDAILPAINALMSFLAKATAYIAAFISAIFGKTYKQSYQAAKGIETARKSMEGFGKKSKKSGKEAKGALAAFDELNTLDFSKNDADVPDAGGGGAGDFEMQMPDMDIDGIQSKMDALAASVKATFDKAWAGVKQGWDWTVKTFGPSFAAAWGEISPVLERWKAQFVKMFNDIMTLGEPLKNWFLTGVVPMWQQGIELAGHVLAGLLDVVLQIVTSLWDAAFPILDKFVTDGLPRLTEFLMGAQDIFRGLFDLVKQIFDDIWQGVIDPVMQLISKIIQDALDIIFKWWDEWGKKIVDGLKQAVDKLKELWTSLWEKFLKPITQSALKFLTELWDKHLKGLVTEVLNFVGKLATAALDILNKFVMPIVNWLVQKLGPIFASVFGGVLKVIGEALGGIIDAAKGIIKALGGIVDFIAGVFTGDWKRAWNGIKTFMQGIGDGIVGIFKGAVNAVIEALNWMIKQVNKISIDVPEWVPGIGGKSLGFKVPTIPKLAKGGLAYGPTLAMVGDNKGASADPEVISPLSKLEGMLGAGQQPMIEILLLILDAIKNNDRNTVLSINGTEIGKIVIQAINDITRRTGKSPLITTF
jgi:predicted  nucleic acid-binding Zn-ribbon protein